MSGIFGILNRDGAPVDREWLGEMTRSMSDRGPDAQEVWADGAVGLGHTLLRTTCESAGEQQPCTLDGQVWITADARVDGRAELIGKLESASRREVRQATDAELILHAYQVWGEECLEHLIGDFAFIIWDGRRRVWFCARDQFGLKPFYYAEAGHSLLCGNTLSCLRLAPGVSDDLNDLAIADFLLFGSNLDPAKTYFAGIERLPPGHYLVCTGETLRIRRYWTLPRKELRYHRAQDYLDHFRELLEEAVKDRLRTEKVAILLSGGLDSTLIAAVAKRLTGQHSLRAVTVVYDRAIPDQERKYSRIAAEFLGIPQEYVVADDYELYDQDLCWQFSKPALEHVPLTGLATASYRKLSGYTRVVLSGQGGDPALLADDGYIADYLKTSALGELLAGIWWCLRWNRGIPRLGLRSLIKKKLGKGTAPFRHPHPVWLNREFEKRLGLTSRWDRLNQLQQSPAAYGRSKAHQDLQSPVWSTYFELLDPGSTRFPIEQRNPFFDIRVTTFMAGLPPLPWCQEKTLLREAGRGMLPDSIRFRPKAPLAGDPIRVRLNGCGPDWWAKHLDPVPELARYVDLDAIPRATASGDQLHTDIRLVSLNYWLRIGRTSPKLRDVNRVDLRS